MEKIKTLVIASGYFNPIHKGHIEYLNRSKALGDFLYVIVNNDYQRSLKGSRVFQPQAERRLIVKNIKSVDDVIVSIDENREVANTIKLIHSEMKDKFDKIIFTNGGDQTTESESEKRVCDELGIEMVFGLGDKIQSSSWLLDKL
jgi:glycerol-3-phosphate cytidylyltransferase/D-beta-D-heptose 7-phosphate kinase/D-beta-D-heptose 1-phosphate adenosyltransferase